MTTDMKYAVITGANKGIGYGIVETLSKTLEPKAGWTIILAARNSQLGEEAAKKFSDAPVKVVFHQLDITDAKSIDSFAKSVKDIDILVNNAGMAYKNDSTAPFAEQARVTLETNFTGMLNLTKALLPNLRQDARVVNVSSVLSTMTLEKLGDDLYKRFTSPMKMDELVQLMKQFVDHAEKGDFEALGWPKSCGWYDSAYGVSKLGVTKMTYILHEEWKGDKRNIVINACCPGYVSTDLTSHQGHKTIQEGADTPSYLATLPLSGDIPKGEFVADRQVKEWKK